MDSINRKEFLSGAGALAAGAMGAGALAGASVASADEAAGELGAESPAEDWETQVAETRECDVVVVGSGVSGMAAAVQAAELGLSTLVIEAAGVRGCAGPEGISGIGSTMAREQGIEVNIGSVVEHDAVYFNYRLNCLTWIDMLQRSGENIDWLVEKGVLFDGVVDNYKNMGKFPMFHWFPRDIDCFEAYGDPMEAALLGYGGEIVLDTRGRSLVIDESGTVKGLYATHSDGTVLRVDAKAVILAAGGYAASNEMVAERFPGLHLGRWHCDGVQTNVGDGLNMAIQAGGADVSRERCLQALTLCECSEKSLSFIGWEPKAVWVNGNGERFVNERCSDDSVFTPSNPVKQQYESYSVFDSAIISSLEDKYADGLALATACAENEDEIYMADTLEELAEKVGFDPETFAATIERYNGFCETGEDLDFMKPADSLVAIAEPPFFAARQCVDGHCNNGCIATDRQMRVTRFDMTPIEGLYAVGNDGNMNYRETYTIQVPGSNMCGNVDSGRVAAKHAASVILGA